MRPPSAAPHLLASAAALALAAALPFAAPASAQVGVAAAVNQDAQSTPPGRNTRILSIGEDVVFNERIATDAAGLVQLLMVDGTSFTVGPNSDLVIDEFVYDPASGNARVVATVTKGAFRFIGGRTSQQEGGAVINTPVGTIGIRGAMLEGKVEGDEALFSMIFGDEAVFTGTDGATSRIREAGYTLEVSGTGGGQSTNIRPRGREDAAGFQALLAGKPGTSGGAGDPPTDSTVANSPVVAVVSSRETSGNAPLPRPRPVQPTDIAEVEDIAETDTAAQDEVRDEVVEETDPPVEGKATRVVTASPDPIVLYEEDTVDNPGAQGVLGGSGFDEVVGLLREGGRLVSAAAGIDLPDFSGSQGDSGLAALAVTDGQSPLGPVSGTAYAGAGDFVAYLLGVGGDPTRPFHVLYGTPTDILALLQSDLGGGVRTYTLTADPLRPMAVPFMAHDIYGEVLSGAAATDLLVIEPQSGDPEALRALLAWLHIEGEGGDQRSAALVYATSLQQGEDPTDAFFLGPRRGSFRHAAGAPSTNMRGAISTIAGGEGGHLFGDNAQNFVIGQDVTLPDAYFDTPAGPGVLTGSSGYTSTGVFGTRHVADLVGEVSGASLSRTTRTLDGFMAGIGETRTEGFANTIPLVTTGAPNFQIRTNAETNTVRAEATVHDVTNANPYVEGYELAFGRGENSSGASAFIDDSRYAALHNSDPENTRLLADSGASVAHSSDPSPGSYLVSGRAVPLADFSHDCETCAFIEWGWWGTRVRVENDGTLADPNAPQRTDFVHLGTWVAGDISDPSTLPTGLTATFTGTALGSVVRNPGTDNVQQYIARGDMNMSWDFDARDGSMTISDFDGMTFSGSMSDQFSGSQALFGGSISGTAGTGTVQGAFVNNGNDIARGIISDFEITGSGLHAVGTTMGVRP